MEEASKFINSKNKKRKKYSKNYSIDKENNKIKILIYFISFFVFLMTFLIIVKNIAKNYYKNNQLKSNKEIFKKLFLLKEDKMEITNKNKIHICMDLDNNLVYPTLVSMTSALENCDNNKNILVYYLLISHDFDITNCEILESLKLKYQVIINYYMIPPRFIKLRSWTSKTTTIYYKFYMPFLFPNLERYIFLDGDTLIYKDLGEMYKLEFNDNYVLGYPFHTVKYADISGVKMTNYINSGVMLVNNKKIIDDNKDAELLDYTLKNCHKLSYPTQDPINIVFHPHVGFLPLKYGIYLIGSINVFEKEIKKDLRVTINQTELLDAIKDPAIIHFSCCNPKVWHNQSFHDFKEHSVCQKYHNEFYLFAKKTDYYKEILYLYMNKTEI